jgi:glycosyltransferase involved in cell wall biosynthesis
MRQIAFISEGSDNNSSTKHRCLMISSELRKRGYDSKVFCRSSIRNSIPNLSEQIKQWKAVIKLKPDVVILHRSCNFIDSYMLNRIAKNCRIIYDFDDALFEIRQPGKCISYSYIDKIIEKSNGVFAGSHYLVNYAKRLNEDTFLIPTPVDSNLFFPPDVDYDKDNDKVTIGWLGGGNKFQLRYLKLLRPPLKYLAEKYPIRFKIISSQCKEVETEFRDIGCEVDFGLDYWAPLEEMPKHISDFDIGVMPLTDDPYSRGKCAMKAIEYMSMKIPVVASAVGENVFVVNHGYNGLLASNTQEWISYLEILIKSESLRTSLGQNGRRTIEEKYSMDAITSKIVNALENLV